PSMFGDLGVEIRGATDSVAFGPRDGWPGLQADGVLTETRRESDGWVTGKRAGTATIESILTGIYQGVFPIRVAHEVTCVGEGPPGGMPSDVFGMGALEVEGKDYAASEFVLFFVGDIYAWRPESDVPPLSIDTLSTLPIPSADSGGYGARGAIPEKTAVVERTKLQDFSDAYGASLPSGLSTRML